MRSLECRQILRTFSITDSELEQELGVIYDPVCIAVPYSAPNQENAVKWIKVLTAGNKL